MSAVLDKYGCTVMEFEFIYSTWVTVISTVKSAGLEIDLTLLSVLSMWRVRVAGGGWHIKQRQCTVADGYIIQI